MTARDLLYSSMRRWMKLHVKEFVDSNNEGMYTEFAEAVCDQFDKVVWLSDPTHLVWDWSVEIIDDYIQTAESR